MGQWINSDGLVVRLGTTEAEVTRWGQISDGGSTLIWEGSIDLVNLGSASAILEDAQDVVFPSGIMTFEVTVGTEIAATGTGATLNLGLIKQDRTSVGSATGFLSAAPLTDFATVGSLKKYAVGVTGIGGYAGVSTTYAGVLCADYDTAAFTAGRIWIRIAAEVPRPSPSNA